MGVAEDISSKQQKYQYKLVSRWNVNPNSNLEDDFLKRGFENLLEQERHAKSRGELSPEQPYENWQSYSEVIEVDGARRLRFMAADPAASMSCVSCHNTLEGREDILSMRLSNGVDQNHHFELNDLMGAIAVDVSLAEVGVVAVENTHYTLIMMVIAGVITLAIAAYLYL